MLFIENIVEIRKRTKQTGPGFDIIFNDTRSIWVTKARPIVALLILIKYGKGSESDLANGSRRIPEIKKILAGKYPPGLIQNFYGDANKPFSELWNEEGFVWIRNPIGQRRKRSQSYILSPDDHDKFFSVVAKKAFRKALPISQLENIQQRLPGLCNLCGSKVVNLAQMPQNAFSRDRLRRCFDHRVPIEKGGNSDITNFQLLCFYCNKSKWQICQLCPLPDCSPNCVLAFPERSNMIVPTGEDISDRIKLL